MSAEILRQFQCEKNRIIEESFACMFANNNDIIHTNVLGGIKLCSKQ